MNAHAGATSTAALRLIAFLHDAGTAEQVTQAATALSIGRPLIQLGGVDAAMQQITPAIAAETIIVDVHDSVAAVAEIGALAGALAPGCRLIVLGAMNDVHLYRDLVAAGASEYLLKPFTDHELAAALTPRATGQGGAPKPPRARMTIFIGARGGIGVSATALSCAWILAEERKQETVLLDLDLQFGTAVLSVNLAPGRALREVLERPARVDGLFVARALDRITDRLALLGGEEPAAERLAFDPSASATLLAHLRESFDHVIVDLPRFAAADHRQMLLQADEIVVITEIGLAGIRDALRMIQSLGEMAPKARIHVATVDRAGGKGHAITDADVAKSLGRAVDLRLLWEPAAAHAAVGQGKPIAALGTAAKLRTNHRTLVDLFAGRAEPASPGLLARLIGATRKRKDV